MSYIGNTATTQSFIAAVDFFSGNGSTVAFTLSRPVASVAQVQATISNVPQSPGNAYTVSGNTITFTSAPPSGTNNIYVYYTSPITQVIAPGQGTVTSESFGTIANFTTTGNTVLGDASTDTLNVGNGGLVKDASGNVGIGTSSPSDTVGYGRTLDIQGSIGAVVYLRDSDAPTTRYSFLSFDGNVGVDNLNLYNMSSTGPLRFGTNGAERMRIDSAGSMGIGDVNPTSRLSTGGSTTALLSNQTSTYAPSANAVATSAKLFNDSATTGAYTSLEFWTRNANNNINIAYIASPSISSNDTGTLTFGRRTGGATSAESMRINSSGNLLVGTASAVNNWNNSLIKMRVENGIQFGNYSAIAEDLFDADSLGICADSTENICFGQYNIATAAYTERARIDSSGNFLVYAGSLNTGSGLAVGTPSLQGSKIFFSGSVLAAGAGSYALRWNATTGIVTYDTSSRFVKENIEDSPYGLAEVLQLKSRKYHRTDDQRDEIGLVADEVQTVMPEFVPLVAKSIFTKDEADTELIAGGVNYDKLTSVLVKAIQEQQALITQLQADVAALKGQE